MILDRTWDHCSSLEAENPSVKITVERINARVWSSIHFACFRSDLMVADLQ